MANNSNVSISVNLTTKGLQGVQQATQSIQNLGQAAAQAGQNAGAAGTGLQGASTGMQAVTSSANRAAAAWGALSTAISTTAIVGAFKSVANQAVEFEAKMAEVEKVLDGGAPAAARMTEEIMRLGRALPTSLKGLAEIAAAAGQMGIAEKDAAGFVELAAKASTAFLMTADETGQAFGQLSSVYKLTLPDLKLFADAINYVGDNSATSEKKVIDVAQRVGSIGMAAGISKEQLLALAGAALPAVGNSAERVSTGMNALISTLAGSKNATDKQKNAFKQLGIDTTTYAESLRKDAIGSLTDFKKKLDEFKGADKISLMKDLFGGENYDEILATLGNIDKAAELYKKLGDAANYAGGVQKSFDVQARTTEAQLQLLKNALNEAAINAGAAFLPAIVTAAKSLADLTRAAADFAKENPKTVQSITAVVGGFLLLRTAGAALTLLLPSITGALTAMGAAAAGMRAAFVTGAGGLAAMKVAAGGLIGALGSVRAGMLGVLALAPYLAEEFTKSQQRSRALTGKSTSAEDAKGAIASIDEDLARLEKTYAGDTNNEVYRFNKTVLTDSRNKAQATLNKRVADDEAEKRKAVEEARKTAEEARAAMEKAMAGGTKTYDPKEPKGGGKDRAERAAQAEADAAAARAQQFEKASEQSLRVAEDNKLAILRSAASRAEAELDDSYARRLITTEQYEAQKLAIQKTTLAAEDQMLRERMAREQQRLDEQEAIAAGKGKQADAARVKAEEIRQTLSQTDAKLQENENKRAELEARTNTTLYNASQRIQAARAQLGEQLLRLQGRELDAARARMDEERRQFYASEVGQDPQARADFEKAQAIQALRDQYEAAGREFEQWNSRLSNQATDLRQQLDAGLITTREYQQQLREANRATAAELQQALDKMLELQAALEQQGVADPQLAIRIDGLRNNLKLLATDTDEVAKSINEVFADGMVKGLTALIDGSQSSFKRFLQGILADVFAAYARIEAMNFAQALTRGMGGQNGGIGGLISGATRWLGNALGFADGGIVRGPGGPRSDLIPAWLSNGEAVLTADAVKLLGEDFIHLLNRRSRRFADGGVVGGRSSGMAALVAPQPAVRIVNQFRDDEIAAALDSPAGERVVLNIIERRRESVGLRR